MTLELVPWRGSRVPLLSQSEVSRASLQDYLQWILASQQFMGAPTPITTYGNRPAEPISSSFEGFIQGALYGDGPVASVEAYRLRVFGQAPLLYQEIVDGRAGDMFDDDVLDRLRAPWAGATLSDLMKRVLIYGDFAGNGFILDLDDELVLIRPDWVEIVLGKRMFRGGQVGWKQVGIMYYEGGLGHGDGVPFLPGEYAHFVPGLPDPLATYRGMSWLTPVIREIRADKSASDHKLAFFENAASPNLAVSLPKEITPDQFKRFVEKMEESHRGTENAYKTLYTGGGADVTVIGANMQQMDFSSVQGKGETRLANAAGVPPTLLSFSEGMQGSSLNAGNYTAAKRNFVDTTMRDLWSNFAGSVQQMDAFRPPRPKARLWYDGRDIPFLHEDAKDLAEIQQTRASTINTYVTAGFQPETAVEAIAHDDVKLLKHTGLTSVQLLPPGQTTDGQPTDTSSTDVPADVPADGTDLSAEAAAINDQAVRAFLEAVDDVIARVKLGDDPDEDLHRAYNPDQLREHKGTDVGGRFASTLKGRLSKALDGWLKGEVHADPLADFNRDQLRTIAKQRGVVIRPRMPLVELKSAILQHVRDEHGGAHSVHPVQDAMGAQALEQKARTRQAEIDHARHVADVAATVHELVGNEASPDVIRRTLKSLSARNGVDTTELQKHADDPKALTATADAMAAKADLTRIGDVGQPAPFDRKLHKPIGGALRDGQAVEVVRPGHSVQLSDGEHVQLDKAVVEGVPDGVRGPGDAKPTATAPPGPAAKMAELNSMAAIDARDALDSMSRPEVYALAQHLGEKGVSKHRKRELVDLVLTHRQVDASPTPSAATPVQQSAPAGTNKSSVPSARRIVRDHGWSFLSSPASNAIDDADRRLHRGESAASVAAHLRRQADDLASQVLGEGEVMDRQSHTAEDLRAIRDADTRKLRVLADELAPPAKRQARPAPRKAADKMAGPAVSGGSGKARSGNGPATAQERVAATAHAQRLVDVGAPTSPPIRRALSRQADVAPRSMTQLDAVHLPEPGSPEGDAYVRSKVGPASAYYTSLGLDPETYSSRSDASNPRPAIWFSPNWHGTSLGSAVRRGTASGWSSPTGATSPLEEVAAHEFGHHVASVFFDDLQITANTGMPGDIALRLLPVINDALGTDRRSTFARNGDLLEPVHWGPEADRHFSVAGQLLEAWVGQNRDTIKQKVSGYGATNFHEMLAEIWQEYSTKGTDARPHIRVIGDLMRDVAEEARA